MTLIVINTSKLAKRLLVVLLCSSFITTFVIGTGFKCKKVDCGCQFKDESGTYEISMKSISKRGKPFYTNVRGIGHSWTYDIDPCYGFTNRSDCEDVTMCQYSSDGKERFPVARYDIVSYSPFVDRKSPITVVYNNVTYGEPKATRQMKIVLTCSELGKPPTVKEETGQVNVYKVAISSPEVCPKKVQPNSGGSGGPSTGTILVIIFFVVLVVYLVAGVLFMKYRRGATGREVIPNIEFWSSLPGLIKDGCVFFGKNIKELCGRCCQREGYNEI